MMRKLAIGVGTLAAASMGLALVAAPVQAKGAMFTVTPPTQAPLSADGTTAQVTLVVKCKVVSPAPITVRLRQRSGSGTGRSGTSYRCNGRSQRVIVTVAASGSPFRTGAASLSTSVKACSATGCSTNSTARSIQLT
jgi:hypothetical protein